MPTQPPVMSICARPHPASTCDGCMQIQASIAVLLNGGHRHVHASNVHGGAGAILGVAAGCLRTAGNLHVVAPARGSRPTLSGFPRVRTGRHACRRGSPRSASGGMLRAALRHAGPRHPSSAGGNGDLPARRGLGADLSGGALGAERAAQRARVAAPRPHGPQRQDAAAGRAARTPGAEGALCLLLGEAADCGLRGLRAAPSLPALLGPL